MHRAEPVLTATPGSARWSGAGPVSALLELHGVTAGYGGGDVLRDLDLGVEAGSITCVVGPNGAGKSTVLRVVSGLLRPRAGEVTFDGGAITGRSPRAVLALGSCRWRRSAACSRR
jgi:ABC-type branched-subunit amino acid transport system ATPase component